MKTSMLAALAVIFGLFPASLGAQGARVDLSSTAVIAFQPSGEDAIQVKLVSGSINNVSFQILDGASGKLLGQIDATGIGDGNGQLTQVRTIMKAHVGQEIVLRLREQGIAGGVRIRFRVESAPRNIMVQRSVDSAITTAGTPVQPMAGKCRGYMVLSDDCTLSANCTGEPLFNLVTCTVVECERC